MGTKPGAHRSAAITGAGSGLGRSVALKLADNGYRVVGTALATAEVSELQHAIKKYHRDLRNAFADITFTDRENVGVLGRTT